MIPGCDKTLEMDVRETAGLAVVRLRGSAGMNEAERIRSGLCALTEREVPTIVLDLSEMDFICSAALGAMILAHLRTRRYSGQVRLAGPQQPVMKLLETARLTKVFPVFSTFEEAMVTGEQPPRAARTERRHGP